MNHHISTISHPQVPPRIRQGLYGMLILLPALIAGLAVSKTNSELGNIIFAAIADAYVQVSTFVAGTLLIFYYIEKYLKIDATSALRRDTIWQVPVAAALGALPGCGGAVIVMTQYVKGRLSFGSVVAVLTATMGDAAFLLIAQEPFTAITIIALGFIFGTTSGWIINSIHGGDFLRSPMRPAKATINPDTDASPLWIDRLWLLIMIPGLTMAVMVAFQIDTDALFASSLLDKPTTFLGVIGGVLALTMQLATQFGKFANKAFSENSSIIRRTIADTNFVTTWVVAAFLVFELTVHIFGLSLQGLFTGATLYLPIIAILVGFLPGCGPQILVTTMYLSGYIPLSAQIGNALSNDGDALFPAIAIAPFVALVATLYSAIPALIVSYAWLFLFEMQ